MTTIKTKGSSIIINDEIVIPISRVQVQRVGTRVQLTLDNVRVINSRIVDELANITVNGATPATYVDFINRLFLNFSGASENSIEYAHWACHKDTLVSANYLTNLPSAGNILNLLIKVPEDLEHHSVFIIQADAASTVDIYEGTTVSADGTAIIHTRNNRYSTKNNIANYHTPTITNDGSLMYQTKIFAPDTGFNILQTGGGKETGRFGSEWILKPSTNYLVRITTDADDTDVFYLNEYYEVKAGENNNEI